MRCAAFGAAFRNESPPFLLVAGWYSFATFSCPVPGSREPRSTNGPLTFSPVAFTRSAVVVLPPLPSALSVTANTTRLSVTLWLATFCAGSLTMK